MKKTFGIRFGRVILAILRPFVFLLYPYKIIGKEKLPKDERPLVVCCNHISMFDPILMLLAFHQPVYFMAKESLFKNKLLGAILRSLFGVFPVNRGKGDTTAITKAFSIVEGGSALGIFPEGTRSKDGNLGPAKSGTALIIAKMQADMLPCAIFAQTGKVKMFHRTTLVVGDIVTPDELSLSGEKPDIRRASRSIMSIIGGLLEENRV